LDAFPARRSSDLAAVGTAAVLIPLATDTASGAVEQAISQLVGDVSDKSVDEHKEKVEDLVEQERKKIYAAGEEMTEGPLENFMTRHGISYDSAMREDLVNSRLIGYGAGNDRAQQVGNEPETG